MMRHWTAALCALGLAAAIPAVMAYNAVSVSLGRLAARAPGASFPSAAAQAIIDIASAKMSLAVREVSVAKGYDPRDFVLVASGGAGAASHFLDVFESANVSGALAASVFHTGALSIPELKAFLAGSGVEVRP